MRKELSKGQISVFVIISIIIVIGAIAIISFNGDNINFFADDKSSYKVKEFVETCLESETKQAVDKIGLAGGWLYHEPMLFSDNDKPDIYNKNAKGLDFLGKMELPYWFYYDDSDEVFKYNIPEYDGDDEYSIKNQVNMYLEDNLDKNCIRGFMVFEDIYDISYEPRDIKGRISVEFDEDEIITSLDLPLEIYELNKDTKDFVDYFEVEQENKLWVAYHLALDIVSGEANSAFIEKRILSFMNAYQTSDNRELLPPFYDFKMEYDFRPWKVDEVKELTQQIINANLGLIQFLNTDYNEQDIPEGLDGSEFVRGFVDTYSKDYLSENSVVKDENSKLFREYRDYSVRPIYENAFFPMFFNLEPSMGNTILLPRPESVISILPFFFTEYTAVYEMSMPILFEIRNTQNPNDKFVFKLVVEANIDHNTPLIENRDIDIDTSALGLGNEKSLICDPLQSISDYVYMNITDPINFGKRDSIDDPITGVEGAQVSFDCKGLAKCQVAQTKINGRYASENITELKFRLPIDCNPGELEVIKFGNRKITIDNLDPKLNEPINLGERIMPSKKEMDLVVKLIDPDEDSRLSAGHGLGVDDSGFLIMTLKEDDSMVDVIEFNRSNQDDLSVKLTTGNYSVQGFILYDKPFTIPSESMDGATVEAMDFESWVRAGVDYANFNVEIEHLLGNDEVIINFVDFGVPESFSDLEALSSEMGNLESRSDRPYFK